MREASPTLAMKYLILSWSLLIVTSCSHAIAPEVLGVLEVSHDKLVERDGVTYQIDSDEPFTGRSVEFHQDGKLWRKTDYEDGKADGFYQMFHANGQLATRVNYKDGEKEGLGEWFWENGQLGQIGYFEDGKKEGLYEMFNEKGVLIRSVIYKNGVRMD